MRYLILLKSDGDFGMPPTELFTAIGELGAEAVAAGVFVETGGLAPLDGSTLVTLAGGEITVSSEFEQSPAETVAAYTIYDVESVEEVVAWTERFFEVHRKHWPVWSGKAEIRQIFNGM
ncbi:YciI family protein [Kitasatospora sp. NPDC059088]|uniref:YciI family protein n=1 Tax=unclassified Kitasatospora TaxID=2633591 RepID=UPI0036D07ECA